MSHSENAARRPSILSVIAPYWKSEEKWFAWSMVAVSLCIIFGHIYVSVWANKLAGQLTDTLVNRNWAALQSVIVLTITATLISGIVPHINVAIQQTVQLRWRQWMTRKYLERWARCSAFYGIERDHLLDNADQRIAENIPQLTQQVLDYTLQAISVITNIITYSILLWNLAGALSLAPWGLAITIPGYMVAAAFLYTFGAFAVTHWTGKPLLKLNNKMQTTEADFRYRAMQLRENAEQIAFFQGGAREGEMLQVRFKAIFNNTRAVISRTLKVMVTQTTYADVFFLLPTLLALPRYVLGAISMGDVIRLADGFRSLRGSLSWFYQAYTGFAMLVTNLNRVRDLVWAMDKVEAQHRGIAVNEAHTDAHISGNGIHIHTPQGHNILHVGEFCFRSGERWLVRGRSGAGKSTFLRALAGLWPYGEGQIDMPGNATRMFLPQRSYLPEGSLKAALCYPQAEEAFSDEVCQAALRACCLGERAASLHSAERWQHVLSGGEQQRLAIARVLLHKPHFIFLDEATSALDSETEHIVYTAIISALPDSCIVSIAHRAELAALHSHTLNLARHAHPGPLQHTAIAA